MDRTIKTLNAIVTWGALWGMCEATVGHALHIARLPLGWLFWYPLAFFFMHRAYMATGRPYAAWGAAVIASMTKLVDLIAPIRLDYVVNPAVSILMEGAVVSAMFAILARSGWKWRHTVTGVVLTGTAWRGLYLLYALLIMPEAWRAISPLASAPALIRFALRENAANIACTLAYAGLIGMNRTGAREPNTKGVPTLLQPLGSALLLIAAVIVQLKW